ncbi:bifunctional UDP-N-acetylglucosamine diphosphorylase/glucosamine-1-phosphate N-acetyltransferase GlmU [Novispirillum sp. DQ9]|uniref:bifunctional UDP-N-acetylglucosamine diphosphorylase/glucosamine-1-phosphate N-acetyltransferase GlmU n=1 Tax=Novispirillum sp. DQ9 TaxID=3398612 RepID=UPI003C79C2AD
MPDQSAARSVAAVVLAAGMGTRMKSARPKVLHAVLGRPMVSHVVAGAEALGAGRTVVVIGPDMAALAAAVAPHPTVEQTDRLGTAHAVAQARAVLEGFTGTVLVLYGDTPLITRDTLDRLLAAHAEAAAGVSVLGFRAAVPGGYGRLITGAAGLEAIVEARDATPEQLAIDLCNSGVMAVDAAALWGWLDRVGNANAKGEYYLTDIVALARADGRRCVAVEGAEDEFLGVNSRAELAVAERIAQDRMRAAAMAGGATLVDPASVHFSWDTVLGRDVVVGPFTVFGPGVTVGDDVEIKGFCHFENCSIATGATVGPYARLRPGAAIGEGAHIGNFVEVKKAVIEPGAKVNHLTYIGDARVGAKANIGAGTITCNYDGFGKYHTDIGAGAFIGSNTALVAPVKIGDGAMVAAGSVITRAVPADALALGRGEQSVTEGWAARFRAMKQRAKAAKDAKAKK